jgi:type IV pilus assembly protein PilQ
MSPKSSKNQMEHIRVGERRPAVTWVVAVVVAMALPAVARAKPLSTISSLTVTEKGDSTVLKVSASSRLVYSVFKLENPPRLTIDISNARFEGVDSLKDVQSWAVSQVATTQFRSDGAGIARVMISFRRPSGYAARAEGSSLIVTIAPREPRPKGAAKSDPAAELAKVQAELKAAKHDRATAEARVAAGNVRVRDIRCVDHKDRMQVEITLDGKVSHQLQRAGMKPLLALEGVVLPRLLQRTLDASELAGPVERVTSYVADARRGTAYIRVELRRASEGKLRQEGQKLVWEFPKAVASRTAAPSAPRRDSTITYDVPQVAPARVRRQRTRAYSGRRIDLDFKDADIHNILRLLSDVGNVNIITSDQVQGRVTIRMKNVPWDQAMDVILRAKGMGQVREGNLIRVAPAADLEKERETEIARMKQIILLKPLETRLIPLSYAQASGILNKLQYTLSPRGKLTFDERTNMVIARDIGGNLDLMERLIRNLDTQTPQVLIEARIVEARSNYSREIGIQWGGNFVSSSGTGNATGLVFPNQIGIGGGTTDGNTPTSGILLGQAANPNFVVNMPAATGSGAGGALGLTLGSVSGAVNVNLRLSAAESMGDIRIISAPKITTLDNVEAKIEQGVTIPFSQVSAAGVSTTFRDAKMNLTVKPHVTADGSIIMKVSITRNEPDFVNTGARGDPTILKKEAQTELLVKDGDTTVIGGIYTTRTGTSHVKVPWFGDIPILGFFFRHKKDTSDREEVLVFITPRIINRAASIGGR